MHAGWLKLFFFIVTMASATWVAGQSAIPWQSNIENAKQIAAQTNRLVLVHFWTETCGPCMRMERDVFPRPEVHAAIEANYIPVRINVQRLPHVAREFGVTAWPTDVILTPTGKIVDRKTGAPSAAQYAAALNQIAAVARRPAAQSQQVAQATGAPISGTIPPSGSDRGFANPAFGSSSGVPSQDASVASSNANPYGYDARASASRESGFPQGAATSNQIGRQSWQPEIGQWNRGAPPSASLGYETSRASVPLTSPPMGFAPRTQTAALQNGGTATVPHATMDAAPMRPSNPGASVPPVQGTPSPQGTPPRSPPLALDGYCCVTLSEQERWVRGDTRYGVIHRGRTYLFAGPDEAKRFFARPDSYAPVLSGMDVVAAVDENRQVPGKREHGAWYEGRVYLFSSEASLRKFDQNPARYAEAATQVAQAGPPRVSARSESQPYGYGAP